MFYIKTYIHILAVLTLFSCNLTAVKEIECIKNHDITIKKNPKAQNTPNILDETSIHVFHIPVMKNPLACDLPKRTTILLDKTTLAFGDGEIIKIIDTKTGFCKKTIHVKDVHITNMIKITKKIFASGHFYGNVKIWDITKPDGEECIKTFKEHSVWIYDLLKISETLIASCDVAGIINMWDLTKPENMAHIKIFYTIRLTGAKLTYTPKGRVIAGSINGEIADSNIKKPEASPAYETWYNGFINSIAYVPKNKIVIGNDNGKIVIMDMKKKGKFVFQSENPHIKQKLSGVITHMLTFSPNTILSCTNDGVITVWHLDKPYEWLQEIDGFSFLRKNYDYIVSFNYEEEEQTLILTTKNGLIITCDFNKNSKDKNYFFKNLKTSIKLQTFKDASIFY